MSTIHIPYEQNGIDVNIILGSSRYVKLEIKDDLTVDMNVPIGMEQDMIHRYIYANREQIIREYERKKNRNHQALETTLQLEEGKLVYRNGLRLPYLGSMDLRLCIKHVPQGEETKIYFDDLSEHEKVLTIRTDNDDQEFIKYCIMRYYKKLATGVVRRYVKEFSEKLGLTYRDIHITNLTTGSRFSLPRLGYSNLAVKNQTTLWGRCTRKHTLKFDWKLAMLPVEVIQYIIVHELTHMKKMNHSKSFWAEVNRVMPEYEECGNWLRKHGKEYEIF